MSDLLANGHAVERAELRVPKSGPWTAEVKLAEGVTLTGSVALAIGGRELRGTVRRGRDYQGDATHRIVGGADGWRKSVAPQGYYAAEGVRLRAVLGDAAAAVGETVVVSDRSVGGHFVRQAGPASRVLGQVLAPTEAWWIDDAGVTQVGARPAGLVASSYEVLDEDDAAGLVLVASETPLDLDPGRSVVVGGAERVILLAHHVLDKSRVRSSLWTVDVATGLRDTVRGLFPRLDYLGHYAYRVVSQDGPRLELEPVRPELGMPALKGVSARPGIGGARTTFVSGTEVVVAFVDGDPSRPFVAFVAGELEPGAVPEEVELGASDLVAIGPDADMVELGSGSEIVSPVDATGRPLRWGDTVLAPTIAQLGTPFVLSPAPGTPVAKVRA